MSRCLISKNSYINIQPFMVINLELDGVSLLVYALIYGHTVNKGVFYGSLEYMAQWCHCTTRNITNCVNKLVERNLIRRKKTPKGCFYMANPVEIDLPEEDFEEFENPFEEESSVKKEKTSEISEKSSGVDRKKVPVKTEKSSSNNLVDKLDNKLDDIVFGKSETKKAPLLEREPVNDLERIEKLYLQNYQQLYNTGQLVSSKPIINWLRSRKLTNEAINQYGFDLIYSAVQKSKDNKFCIEHGYVLTTILSAGVLAGLVNGGKTKNSVANDEFTIDGEITF